MAIPHRYQDKNILNALFTEAAIRALCSGRIT